MAMLLGLVRPTSGARHRARRAPRPTRALPRARSARSSRARRCGPRSRRVENLRVLARLGGNDVRRIPERARPRRAHRPGRRPLRRVLPRHEAAARHRRRPARRSRRCSSSTNPPTASTRSACSEMRDLLGRLAVEDRTVLVSSHMLSELEQISDWLLIIDHGRLVYAGEAAGFAARANTEILLAPADDRPAAGAGRCRRRRRPRRRARWRSARRRGQRPRPAAARGIAQPGCGVGRHRRSPSSTSAVRRWKPTTSACSKEKPDDPHLPRRARQAGPPQGRARHRGRHRRRSPSVAPPSSSPQPSRPPKPDRVGGCRWSSWPAPVVAPRSSAPRPRSPARSCSSCSSARWRSSSLAAPSARCCCASPGGYGCSPASSPRC